MSKLFKPFPPLLADFYKFTHPDQYPSKTEYVYTNCTARSSRVDGVSEVIVFNIQYLIEEYLTNVWNEGFFSKPKDEVIAKYKRFCDNTLGKNSISVQRLEALHDLGYLPLHIKALPEGTRCPLQVPFMTIRNTDPRFYWLTNFVETLTQTVIWQPMTSATTSDRFKGLLLEYADKTGSSKEFVPWQGHDFSMRGMSSVESGFASSAGHMLSFTGTDTAPAIEFLERFYDANIEQIMVGGAVPATEHCVMCAGGEDDEEGTVNHLITNVYPTGVLSVVSDTWNYWNTLCNILLKLRDKILARNGKYVVRPDSGDPVKIVTGYFPKPIKSTSAEYIKCAEEGSSLHRKIWENDEEFDCIKTSDGKYFDIYGTELADYEVKGSIQVLYEIFGGSPNKAGFIELDPHIGLIYGDGITYERCEAILSRLAKKNFASSNVVFGIGSYTFQNVTRDTYGLACKATHVVIDGHPRSIFKDPKTGSGKKSAKGLLSVQMIDGEITLIQDCTEDQEKEGLLETVFLNGQQYNRQTLVDIRNRLSVKYSK